MQQQTVEPTQTKVSTHQHEFISKKSSTAKLSAEMMELIDKLRGLNQWNLSSKKYPSDIIIDICQNIKDRQCVNSLFLHWNESPSLIISVIPEYPMPNLKILNIGGNHIESLEFLQKGSFDHLEQLWLWFNRLVRVDSLRKCTFPCLKYLDLGDNHILEFPKLSQMHAPLLQRVNIQKNRFNSLTNFVKPMLRTPSPFILLFMDNLIVKAFHQPRKKGNKKINNLTYIHKEGEVNLKFN